MSRGDSEEGTYAKFQDHKLVAVLWASLETVPRRVTRRVLGDILLLSMRLHVFGSVPAMLTVIGY